MPFQTSLVIWEENAAKLCCITHLDRLSLILGRARLPLSFPRAVHVGCLWQECGIWGLPCAQNHDGVHCTICAELASVLCMPVTAFEVLSALEPVLGGEGHLSSPGQMGKRSALLSFLVVFSPQLVAPGFPEPHR